MCTVLSGVRFEYRKCRQKRLLPLLLEMLPLAPYTQNDDDHLSDMRDSLAQRVESLLKYSLCLRCGRSRRSSVPGCDLLASMLHMF